MQSTRTAGSSVRTARLNRSNVEYTREWHDIDRIEAHDLCANGGFASPRNRRSTGLIRAT